MSRFSIASYRRPLLFLGMPKKAAFFFGSGISLSSFPKGVASVGGITDSVFKDDWHLTTAKTFAHGKNPNPLIPDDTTLSVKAFLEKVRECADDYLAHLSRGGKVRPAHYEDLFSLAEQASRPEIDHVPNLAVVEFLRRLRKETHAIHSSFLSPVGGADPFISLAETSCDFLHWVVDHTLRNRMQKRSGLSVLGDAARVVEHLDVFTLNHDTLVEEELKDAGFGHEAGFGDRTHGEFSVYQPGWSEKPRHDKTRIFKLHGSLNWYLYEFPNWARQYAIPDGDPFGGHDQNGQIVNPLGWRAAFLSGTIVKEQHYGQGFWNEIFSGFRTHLSQHTHLIFCGYGFGDPGVNLRLSQWAHDNLEGKNTFVVLTADDEPTFFADKPKWMQQLRSNGQIILVNKYLQNCTLADIEPYFDPMP